MIELFNIIISLIIFFLFSFFPITHKYTNKLALSDGRSHFEIFFLNLLINFLFLFFLFFTEIKFLIYFYLVIFFSIILNLKFFVSKIFLNKIKNVIFLFFIFLNLIIYVSIVSDPTLSWDGQKNWYYKAQNFFYEYNFFDLNETKGVKYYPHFGSLLWGFFWKTSYLEYEYFGRLIFVYIFLTSIFALCQLIKKNSFLEFLTISILVLICFDSFLTKGYQELLVFSFLIFVSISIYKYILEKKKLDLLICFICLNMLPWIKNEGYIYVLIFNLSLIFTIKNFSNKNSLIFFIFFSLFFLLIKKIIFYEFLDINLTHGSNLEFTFELLVLKEFMTSMLIGLTVVFLNIKYGY